jgi:hypothetical protein
MANFLLAAASAKSGIKETLCLSQLNATAEIALLHLAWK